MTEKNEEERVRAGLSESEMQANFLRLVFAGDEARLITFRTEIQHVIPAEVAVVVRGSSATGVRWEDGAPFDADGPGTSDIDLTLVGAEAIKWFTPEGFYIAEMHSKPLSDERPDVAPSLVPLRNQLSAMTGRPVNIQATRDWIMFVREYLMGQPWFTLIGKVASS